MAHIDSRKEGRGKEEEEKEPGRRKAVRTERRRRRRRRRSALNGFTVGCSKPFPAPPPLPALTGSVRHLLCIEFLILFSFFPVSSLVSPFLLPSPPSSSSFPLSTNVAQSLPSSGAVAYFPPWMSVCAIYCVRRSIHSWRRSRRTRRWRRRAREGQEGVYCILL